MKLAVSNLAWPSGADEQASRILARHSVHGVELAPGKVWRTPIEATDAEIRAVRDWWESRGFRVVAFQALVFGRPDLLIFDSPELREQLLQYLTRIFRLAAGVGAGPLVFGSPKNRARNGKSPEAVWPVAVEFFRRVGERAAHHGVTLAIEPVPPMMGTDFLNTIAETAQLVRDVDSPGFALHLDGGQMIAMGEMPSAAGSVKPVHYHISEPGLVPLESVTDAPHSAFARELREMGYNHWLSIEVREPESDWVGSLNRSIELAKALYGI